MCSTRSFHGIGRTERLNIKCWLTIDYAIGFAQIIFSLNLFLVWTMGMKTYFAGFWNLFSKKHLLLSIPWINISYYYKLSYIFISSNINVSDIFRKYVSKIVKSLKFYSQANNLVYHSFMDANRRHDTPGSETRQFSAESNSSGQNISIFILIFQAQIPTVKRARRCL